MIAPAVNSFLRYKPALLAGGLLGLFSFGVFGRAVLRSAAFITGSDFVQFYFWEQFTRAELAQGRWPLWNPYFFAGYPFSANPQMMLFYPPAWLLRLLPLDYSFGFGMMLHVSLAGVGMYVLTRALKQTHFGSLVAATTFMLSGVVVTHIKGGHWEWLMTIGWLPWVGWAWGRVFDPAELKRFESIALAGLTTALMFLAGAARVAGVAELMVLVIGLGWLKNWRSYPWVRQGLSILGSGAIVFGLAAPQLLPALEFASLSSRAQGLATACLQDLSLSLFDFRFLGLVRLPNQFPEWERNGYIGGLALTLALIGLTLWRDERTHLWIGWAAAGVLLSVGPATPLYLLGRDLIPGLSLIRQPYTFVVLITFALAGLAGLGAEKILTTRLRWPALIILVLGGFAVVNDLDFYQAHPQSYDFTLYGQLEWVASFSTPRYVLALVSLGGLNRWWRSHVGRPVVLSLLYLDLFFFAYIYLPIFSTPYAGTKIPFVNPTEARLLTVPYAFADRTMASGVANAQGYAPIVLKSYDDFAKGDRVGQGCPSFEHASIEPSETSLLRLLSVRQIDFNGGSQELIENYYPRALWVGEAVAVSSASEAVKLARTPGYDPTQKVFIEGATPSITAGTGAVVFTHYGSQEIILTMTATSAGWLYLNDTWYPGWRAWVNEREVEVVRANGTFRAVRVPSGESVVRMKFESRFLNLGLMLAALTGLTLASIFVWKLRAHR